MGWWLVCSLVLSLKANCEQLLYRIGLFLVAKLPLWGQALFKAVFKERAAFRYNSLKYLI